MPPTPSPRHSRCRKASRGSIESRAAKGAEPIRLSVGVHFGSVILGDIGSARRMEFATLGDTVNVASRLEAATRQLSCRIVASQTAMDAIAESGTRDRYYKDMRCHKALMLKGPQ